LRRRIAPLHGGNGRFPPWTPLPEVRTSGIGGCRARQVGRGVGWVSGTAASARLTAGAADRSASWNGRFPPWTPLPEVRTSGIGGCRARQVGRGGGWVSGTAASARLTAGAADRSDRGLVPRRTGPG